MLTKINGRTKFYSRISDVRKLRAGRWLVQTNYGAFEIEGGRAAGGSSRDWFVDQVDNGRQVFGGKSLKATSLVDALHLLENA
jgi:hypothetical protein